MASCSKMKRLSAAYLLTLGAALTVSAEDYSVYILTGQSNSLGTSGLEGGNPADDDPGTQSMLSLRGLLASRLVGRRGVGNAASGRERVLSCVAQTPEVRFLGVGIPADSVQYCCAQPNPDRD